MDVQNVFHMTGGTGQTSYANNSSLQKNASDTVKHITLEAVHELYATTRPKSLAIADLGCSSGPNTLSIIGDIIDSLLHLASPPPESIQVYLNDLHTNDFNSIFNSLPGFLRQRSEKLKADSTNSMFSNSMIFVAAYPGSFYGRLFPKNSLHFVYSASSVHWLSKVPPALYDEQGKSINKGAVYICEKISPKEVSKAYLSQFKEDFSLFLRLRSEEVISGGRMVLILSGREGPDYAYRGNLFLWELFVRALLVLISQGLVEEEKLDSYDVHFYAPSKEELEDEVKREGSFELDKLEVFENKRGEKKGDEISYGTRVASAVRAIQESMISQHFGEAILDSLFEIYGTIIDEEMAKQEIRPISFVLVLRKP